VGESARGRTSQGAKELGGESSRGETAKGRKSQIPGQSMLPGLKKKLQSDLAEISMEG